jgi:hypothetical protein
LFLFVQTKKDEIGSRLFGILIELKLSGRGRLASRTFAFGFALAAGFFVFVAPYWIENGTNQV